ncbi:MAG: hypothetical protein BGO06_13175 [Shinella sp. 65-6]|uniref:Uncharacterized protein n=1 Tax=Ketogulonicigenium vulgare (strain WSH-001) TaxID=759362 RepID=F9YAR0_KETVW|nr:hypothetical protein KVU_PA0042 [Ketogulonicigenium vulgare WSH-001]OJU92780.1 MAG: hypothetical protein BGO06_13175 [Shinella sp. 65-6]
MCADLHVVRPAMRARALQLGAGLPKMGGRLVALRAALSSAPEPRNRAFAPFGFDHWHRNVVRVSPM